MRGEEGKGRGGVIRLSSRGGEMVDEVGKLSGQEFGVTFGGKGSDGVSSIDSIEQSKAGGR
jgi:hypothetical protein